MEEDFSGSKVAYIIEDKLLVYKRDDFPSIPFPGLWDFPGGGREGNESPEECALRELDEEFSLRIPSTRFIYKKKVESQFGNGYSFFFVIQGTPNEVESIKFGNEGQYWKLMPIGEYIVHPKAIPALVSRLQGYLNS
ncbi:DNA mismatch repair protein MutT [Microbulbifer sp. A4B17]|uniref:NUDIX hydrolase n=1 Tax=Microbulbifer sp. A4B17 TaxID=359370 RepID=UPI000D52CF12|nr:NUDIX hydrolase [Microbulbifer sp. A4B17]AWF81043.1 DNA mismatch repair protein MutT [Microbulbifer sp. A4B17]